MRSFFARCTPGGATFECGPAAPSASLNDGAAGIAYALMRLGRLDAANAWCTRLRALTSAEGARRSRARPRQTRS